MKDTNTSGPLRKYEIPGCVAISSGNGGLPKINVKTNFSAAEIFLHGAHVTHFQKNGEPPLIFMSRKSWFEKGKPIRGGVPVIFPWFGNREGEPSHGFARIMEWQLVKTSADENSATLHFALPKISGDNIWNNLRTEFIVTISDKLTMELTIANESCDETIAFENCLHTYFQIGDINQISISGLEKSPFDDFASGTNGARQPVENSVLRITKETNRVYFDAPQTVEIRDEKLKRTIRVEKSGSNSTVVWNPWTTQKLPDDFDPAEYVQMVCVESGNVKQNKISLAPGKTSALKVILSSASLK
jgi:D-hexose-6-phosphate mutarotase